MSEYHPDKWKLVRIKHNGVEHYRVFGTWAGSYAYGESWKLSSGCLGVPSFTNGFWRIDQSSGSVYFLHKDMEGICGGWHGVIDRYTEQLRGAGGEMTVIENPAFADMSFGS